VVHFTSGNSIIKWADLKKQFHNYLFVGIHEMKIPDLTRLKQRNDETIDSFIQRFREVRNKCYSITLGNKQLVKLASKDSCLQSRRNIHHRSSRA
jgi:hypothetical protein